MDETEVTNFMYLEYLDWLKKVYPPTEENYKDIYEGKYLLAVADIRNKKLLLTCYITDRIKQGDTIWKKD